MFLGGSVAFCRLQRQSLEVNLFFSLKVCRFCGTSSLITISAETRPAERLRRWSWWPNTDSQETGNDHTNGCNLLRWIGQAISQECSQDSLLILKLGECKKHPKNWTHWNVLLQKCAEKTAHRISFRLFTLSGLSLLMQSQQSQFAKWAILSPQSCRLVPLDQETSMLMWALQVSLSSAKVKDGYGGPLSSWASFTRQVVMYCHYCHIIQRFFHYEMDRIRWCKVMYRNMTLLFALRHFGQCWFVDKSLIQSFFAMLIHFHKWSLEQLRQSDVDLQPAGGVFFGQVFLGTLKQQRKKGLSPSPKRHSSHSSSLHSPVLPNAPHSIAAVIHFDWTRFFEWR